MMSGGVAGTMVAGAEGRKWSARAAPKAAAGGWSNARADESSLAVAVVVTVDRPVIAKPSAAGAASYKGSGAAYNELVRWIGEQEQPAKAPKALSAAAKRAQAAKPPERLAVVRLFEISHVKRKVGAMWVEEVGAGVFQQEDLLPHETFLLDGGRGVIWLWFGPDATEEARQGCRRLGQAYVDALTKAATDAATAIAAAPKVTQRAKKAATLWEKEAATHFDSNMGQSVWAQLLVTAPPEPGALASEAKLVPMVMKVVEVESAREPSQFVGYFCGWEKSLQRAKISRKELKTQKKARELELKAARANDAAYKGSVAKGLTYKSSQRKFEDPMKKMSSKARVKDGATVAEQAVAMAHQFGSGKLGAKGEMEVRGTGMALQVQSTIHYALYTIHHYTLCTTMHHTPHTIHDTPCTMHHTPHTIHHTPHAIHHAPHAIHHAPYTIHHTPYTMHHAPCTIHHTPYTIYHTPYTMHHTPYTIHCTNGICPCSSRAQSGWLAHWRGCGRVAIAAGVCLGIGTKRRLTLWPRAPGWVGMSASKALRG
jgi:hypothetical protein